MSSAILKSTIQRGRQKISDNYKSFPNKETVCFATRKLLKYYFIIVGTSPHAKITNKTQTFKFKFNFLNFPAGDGGVERGEGRLSKLLPPFQIEPVFLKA